MSEDSRPEREIKRTEDMTREELVEYVERYQRRSRNSRRGQLASMAGHIASGFAAQPGFEAGQLNAADEWKIAQTSVRIARNILTRIDEVEP